MTTDYNRRKNLRAVVNRFRDAVAIYVGTGETAYLTPKQARKLARALYKLARDVETTRFDSAESLPGTTIDIN